MNDRTEQGPPLESRVVRGCTRCGGTGWLEPIDGWRDGSYITSRPCPSCNRDPLNLTRERTS